MKSLYIFLLLVVSNYALADANILAEFISDSNYTEANPNQNKFLDLTKDALLSYDRIEERTNYFAMKIKNRTFGEYTDNILVLAPALTGKVLLKVYGVEFKYSHFKNQRTEMKYTYKF